MAPSDVTTTSRKRTKFEPEDSSLAPRKRNPLLFNAEAWLRLKNQYDEIDKNLWRINNDLYDLTNFADTHPGGKAWIEATKGTDITEAFEVAHVFGNENKDKILAKYHVRSCKNQPKKSPYTFNENGFYKTLKKRVQKVLREVGTGPTLEMMLIQDGLAIGFHILLLLVIYFKSWLLAVGAGLVLGMNMASSHNFFHQSDNFRMYFWDLTMFSSYDWRVTHMLSHHLHTNTFHDYEVTAFHPLLDYSTGPQKSLVHKLFGPFFVNVLFFVAAPYDYVKKIIGICTGVCQLRPENLIPVVQLLLINKLSGWNFVNSLGIWLLIHGMASFWLTFTTLLTTHRHPSVYVAGDVPHADMDWGVQQIDCVRDVKTENLFLIATTLKHHMLHHLFPTVDHSKLHYLYPILEKTCQDFGLSYKYEPMWDMAIGHYKQLFRRKIQNYEERLRLRKF